MLSNGVVNAFTVDVEDYFQVSGFERYIQRTTWDKFDSRVVSNTRWILALLARKGVRGTFFVLGWIAHRFPALVREIHEAGHELGSHSYWHRLIYNLSPEEFRCDLRASRSAIENAIDVRIKVFRAPSFSITRKSFWALNVLAEEGFTVDSSIFPISHDRYGIPGARSVIHDLDLSVGRICEFPPTVVRLAGLNVPVGGGGYFRLYPWMLTRYLLTQVNRQDRPFMFYVHPWEIDPDQPRLALGSYPTRFRHYVNLRATAQKLERLLDTFRFGTMQESLANHVVRNAKAGQQQIVERMEVEEFLV